MVAKTRVCCCFIAITLLLGSVESAKSAQPAAAAAQNQIPVFARFIRTSSTSAAGTNGIGATGANSADLDLGAKSNERAFEANDASSPMRGLMMAESPLSAL